MTGGVRVQPWTWLASSRNLAWLLTSLALIFLRRSGNWIDLRMGTGMGLGLGMGTGTEWEMAWGTEMGMGLGRGSDP